MDFVDLAGRFGLPLTMALAAIWAFARDKPLVVSGSQHRQQISERDAEIARLHAKNDRLEAERAEQVEKLEARNQWMEARLLEGADRERHVYDALDVPRPAGPPVGAGRRRRPE